MNLETLCGSVPVAHQKQPAWRASIFKKQFWYSFPISVIREGQFYYTHDETSRKAVFRSLHLTLQLLTGPPCPVTGSSFSTAVWSGPHHASPLSPSTPALPGQRFGFSTFMPAHLSLPSLGFSLSAQSLCLYHRRSGDQEGGDGDPHRSRRKRSQGPKTAFARRGAGREENRVSMGL